MPVSDDEKERKDGKTKRDAPSDRDRHHAEPIPKNEPFWKWIEALFYSIPETQHFPERLEVNPVSGRQNERLGKSIHQGLYGTNKETKPTKSRIVEISNEILFKAQRDCDIQRRRMVYGVHAWHFARGDQPYERWLLEMKPTVTFRDDGEPREREDMDDYEGRFSSQVLRHHESMFSLYGGGFEGLLDRMDRILERQDVRIERQDSRIETLLNSIEALRSSEEDRVRQRKWDDLKILGAQRSMEMGFALAPPLLNRLAGRQLVPARETPETVTLKNFFRPKDEGGEMTQDQLDLVFGRYGKEPPHDEISPGVLTLEQGQILWKVSVCELPPDALDDLMPGGKHAITQKQVSDLMTRCKLTLSQLAPLKLIFEQREQAKNNKEIRS